MDPCGNECGEGDQGFFQEPVGLSAHRYVVQGSMEQERHSRGRPEHQCKALQEWCLQVPVHPSLFAKRRQVLGYVREDHRRLTSMKPSSDRNKSDVDSARLKSTVREATRGNHAAATALFDAYYPRVVAYARGKVGRSHVAEDIASETFARVLRDIDRFK